MKSTFKARRPVKVAPDDIRQPGDLVPEAITWFRYEHLVHAGHIVAALVEDTEFDAAVTKYCPELADQIKESS